jgi:hypothetical protein
MKKMRRIIASFGALAVASELLPLAVSAHISQAALPYCAFYTGGAYMPFDDYWTAWSSVSECSGGQISNLYAAHQIQSGPIQNCADNSTGTNLSCSTAHFESCPENGEVSWETAANWNPSGFGHLSGRSGCEGGEW